MVKLLSFRVPMEIVVIKVITHSLQKENEKKHTQ